MARRERHPIPQDMPPADLEGLRRYCFELQCKNALLWDQVWWLSIPFWRRWWYAAPRVYWDRTERRLRIWCGHRSPIRRFYE